MEDKVEGRRREVRRASEGAFIIFSLGDGEGNGRAVRRSRREETCEVPRAW